MEEFKEFIIKYRGAILGGIIASLILILKLHAIIFGAIVIVCGLLIGNYVQKNKEDVKVKIKQIIDKL